MKCTVENLVEVNKEELSIRVTDLEPYEKHKHNSMFKVIGNVLKKVSTMDAWVNYILAESICSGEIYTLDIQIAHSPKRLVSLGIATGVISNEFNTRSLP